MKTNLPLLLVLCLVSSTAVAQPTITSQPADQTANEGYSATFQLRAAGTTPLSYAWFFNQSAIAGATTNKLTITNAQPANAGDYFAIVADSNGSVTSRVAKLTVVLPVKLDPKIGPNILMGEDPKELPQTGRGELEPHIIRSFLDPTLIAAVYSDGRPPDNSVQPATGYSISRDGGLTWRRGLAENLTRLTGGTMVGTGDPVAAIDLAGNIYLANLHVEDMSFLSVSRMTNGAAAFASPVQLGKVSGSTVDKEWIAVNTYPNSPTANRIVLTWAKFDSSVSTSLGVLSSFSDDEAATWSTPVAIFSKAQANNTQPMFLPDGSMVVVFIDRSFRIHSSFSSDGGITYGTNRPVTQVSSYIEPRARNVPYFFSATTDRQAGILYVT
ncbi:MAG: immunoglobulin domain-containing protein, partial [Verrucomicrobiales bacterium]|nr:immunoglobulin domain-containing protein [Verrucomicrobiales bacterium]